MYSVQWLDDDKGSNSHYYYYYFWPWDKGIPENFESAFVNFIAFYRQMSKEGWSPLQSAIDKRQQSNDHLLLSMPKFSHSTLRERLRKAIWERNILKLKIIVCIMRDDNKIDSRRMSLVIIHFHIQVLEKWNLSPNKTLIPDPKTESTKTTILGI